MTITVYDVRDKKGMPITCTTIIQSTQDKEEAHKIAQDHNGWVSTRTITL